jgi:predicted PurR-regulated permease PerM
MLGLGGAVIVLFGIAGLSSIIAPVFLAVILTICVQPLRAFLVRHRIPRGIATAASIIAVTLLLLLFGYAVIVAFGQFSQLLPQFEDQIKAFGEDVVAWLNSLGITSRELSAAAAGVDPSAVVGFVGGLVGGVAGVTSGLIIIFTIALLLGMDAGFVPTVFAQTRKTHAVLINSLSDYAANVRRYMVWTTLLGLLQGFINFIALIILGVPGAFIWGLLAFLCSFIPNVGYFLALIPPVIFGALVGGWPTAIAVIVVYALINAVVQTVIQPRVIGNAVSLSQTITFFSVLLWAAVLGPIGAILAIPLTLLVRLLLVDTDPRMHWVRPILGDFTEAKVIMDDEASKAKAGKKNGSKTPAPTAMPVEP